LLANQIRASNGHKHQNQTDRDIVEKSRKGSENKTGNWANTKRPFMTKTISHLLEYIALYTARSSQGVKDFNSLV